MRSKGSRAALRREAAVFAALGDETRLSLLSRLGEGSALSITRLTLGRGVTRQSITKHLGCLAEAGLVRRVRRGRETCYVLRPESVDEARRSLERISLQWDEALGRLKAMVEEDDGPSRAG